MDDTEAQGSLVNEQSVNDWHAKRRLQQEDRHAKLRMIIERVLAVVGFGLLAYYMAFR